MSPSHDLPRELVLASAGTGKTFRISSRIVGLLELGVEPDEILASTFTRKAAGEILERVLERLAEAALDDHAAEELASHALLRPTSDGDTPSRTDWQEILARLANRLHRAGVSTLDAFFVRIAGTFALELGLPHWWRIGAEPTHARLESEALEDVLASADRGEVLELIRAVLDGEATRSVHDRVLDNLVRLRRLLHQIDPSRTDPWSPFDDEAPRSPTPAEREAAADAIASLPSPTTRSGEPDKRWKSALEGAAGATRDGDWDGLIDGGIGKKVAHDEETFAGKPIDPEVEGAFRDALDLAGRAVRAEHGRRAAALGRLARRFDDALARRQAHEGAYRFEDVTRRLASLTPNGSADEVWYRLDRRARHLLLDEFQDTSLAQWEALRPLAEEIVSVRAQERAVVVVADPKQSIYGWRGAEPELVHRVAGAFALERDRLRRSFRSSSRVLDFVNRVFDGLDRLSVWDRREEDRRTVESWLEDFETHVAARDLPGRVRVEVGPREASTRSDDRPQMMRHAAERIAEISARSPGYDVGVLLRKNRNIPLLTAELRARGIEPSEEGGTALTDSAAVRAVLALLRLADHPGHTIARYEVARSPLGGLVDLPTHDDDSRAHLVSSRVRASLLDDGYGPVLDGWTRDLGRNGALATRDLRRLFQLVELGFEWDAEGASLRPGDFIRFVESERVDDPAAAAVRIMTVHQAKGLEFDTVVLPELDLGMTGGGPGAATVLPERDPATGRIVRVFPYVKRAARPLLPEVRDAARQARAAELRDALGVLYVAMTRARFALHLLVPADSDRGPSSSTTYARLVREILGAHERIVKEGEVLLDEGEPEWPARAAVTDARGAGSPAEAADPVELDLSLGPARERGRGLPHRTPSALAEEGEAGLAEILTLDPDRGPIDARRRGIVIHEWCRSLGWIDDGLPDDRELLTRARRVDPEMPQDELEELLSRFHGWLREPEVSRALSRDEKSPDAHLEREWPFAVRDGDAILSGVVDRLILVPDGSGGVARARILDFKTDRLAPDEVGRRPQSAEGGDPDDRSALDRRARRHRPQLEAYRRAVARSYGLDPSRIDAALIFLTAGRVVTV